MKIVLKLPRLSMDMTEAIIAKWHVKPGQVFRKDADLYDVETDKVTSAVSAPGDGRLVEILVEEGQSVEVGGPVCKVESIE